MKTQTQIVVRVSPEGGLSIEAVGYTGSTCEEATAFLEEALGTVARRRHTPDRHRRNRTSNQQNQQT